MSVIEKMRRAGRCALMMGEQDGMAWRFVQRCLEAKPSELMLKPDAGPFHVVLVSRIGGYRRNPQELEVARNGVIEIVSRVGKDGF